MANFNGTSGNDFITGTNENDKVKPQGGNDIISLGDGYDGVSYRFFLQNFLFVKNGDNSITAYSPNGTDSLIDVEYITFNPHRNHNESSKIEDLPYSNVTRGTEQSEIISPEVGNNLYFLGGGYDQLNYSGSASDYIFYSRDLHSIQVIKPDGMDIVSGVDGVWFIDEQKWYSIDELAPKKWTDKSNYITGSNRDETVEGSAGNDSIFLYEGYDQINYDGSASDYKFRKKEDQSIEVIKPNGTDTLQGVEGVWFKGEEKWYNISDLVVNAPNDLSNNIDGTDGEDIVEGSGGSDQIDLGDGYDQINYPGSASDYIFQNHMHSISGVIVQKPDGSSDYLHNVEGIWFKEEEKWYDINDLIFSTTDGDDHLKGSYQNETVEGSLGNDIIDLAGTNLNSGEEKARYDQINYGGSASEYTFSRGEGEFITVVKPDGAGVDQIRGVDGFWFYGEEEWYSLEELLQNDQQALASDDGAFV